MKLSVLFLFCYHSPMSSDLVHIEFYSPDTEGGIKSKEHLADLIVEEMKKRKSIEYAGHLNEKSLHDGILQYLGNAGIGQYKQLPVAQKEKIQKQIEETLSKCNKVLPVPTKNYVFVFPYLPTQEDEVFRGVMGVARYSCVLHIFLSPDQWSSQALADTVAHELNHTIFYYHHYDDFNNYSLLDEMLVEGLAENFREQVIDETPAPWAVALDKEKAFESLHSMNKKTLESKDRDLIKGVLFGDDVHERWTGYSIGYWLVKELIRKKPDLPWSEIMKLRSHEIVEIAET